MLSEPVCGPFKQPKPFRFFLLILTSSSTSLDRRPDGVAARPEHSTVQPLLDSSLNGMSIILFRASFTPRCHLDVRHLLLGVVAVVVAVGVDDLVIGIVHSHRKGVTSFAYVVGGALSDIDEEPPDRGQHDHDEEGGDGAG